MDNLLLVCFICKKTYSGFKCFRDHLRSHNNFLGENGCLFNIICVQGECHRNFRLFSSFKRHVLKNHKNNLNESDESDNQLHEISLNQNIITEPKKIDKIAYENFIKKSICELAVSANVTSATSDLIVENVSKIIDQTSDYIQSNLIDFLKSSNININEEYIEKFSKTLPRSDILNNIRSEYGRSAFFKKEILHEKPQEIMLGQRSEIITKRNISYEKQVSESYHYISIIETLKNIFVHVQMREFIQNENAAGDGLYKSYRDGKQYSQNIFFQKHKNAIRITLYYDDIEVVNPIGTKVVTHKIGCFYYIIQNFSHNFNCHINNIYILLICYKTDIKKYGFKKILEPFVDEIKLLESDGGVKVVYEDQTKFTLRATLVSFAGDTLAAHEIFEFLSPSCIKFCRMCYISRSEFKTRSVGMDFHLRTPQLHNDDLIKISNGQILPKNVGFEKNSILNEIKYFHITKNYAFDPMHDLLQGICPMEIKLVLSYLIKKKYFTVEYFNQRINFFRYGSLERKNKPSANFTLAMLQSNTNTIKQKAAQMWLLTRVFNFLIIHKITDNEDLKYLKLISLLCKILEICFSFEVSNYMICSLNELILEHHEMFRELFPDKNMINKHHHIEHYPSCMLEIGPIALMSCMAFERKHQPLKKQISNGCNFKNIPKSICQKQSVLQSMRISQLGTYKYENITSGVLNNKNKTELLCAQYIDFLDETNTFCTTNSVFINNIEFSIDSMINLVDESSNENSQTFFFNIQEIILVNKEIYIFGKKYKIVAYNALLNAYQIEDIKSFFIFKVSEFIFTGQIPNQIWKIYNDNKLFIAKKYHD